MRSSTSSLSIAFLTIAILGLFFVLGWFSLWSVAGLAALILVVLLLSNHLWMAAVLIPLSIPIGLVGTLLLGRSYEYDITGVEVVLLLLATAAMYALVWRTVDETDHSSTEFLLALYIVLSVASLFWIEDFAKYLVAVRVAIYHFLAFFIARLLITKHEAREWVLRTVPIVVIVLSVQLLTVLVQLGSVRKILLERSLIQTPVGAMAFVTAIIVLLLPCCIAQYYRTTGWSRWMYWFAGALGMLAVFGSIGKSAILVMTLSLFYLFYRMGKGKLFIKRATFVAVVVVLLASGGSFAPGLILERFANLTGDISSKFRVEEARTAIEVFYRHPIVGVGAGNLKFWFQRLLNGYDGESNVVALQVAAEFGILGLALLAALILSLRNTVHRLNHSVVGHSNRLLLMGFQASLLAAVLHGFLEVTFLGLAYGILFWFLMGMLDAWASLEFPLRKGRGSG